MANNTIVKTFRVLDLISKSNTHLTATEISKELDLPTSTTHDILKTLLEENAIYYKNFSSKTYAIGVRIYALSKSYIYDSNIINVSKEYIKSVCDKYGLGGYVLKPIYNNMIVTYKYESEKAFIKIPEVGYEFENIIHNELATYYETNIFNEHISCVTVPLFDYTEQAIGEIKILGLRAVVEENLEEIQVELMKAAIIISKNLGSTSI